MNRILCSTGALIGPPNGRDFTLLSRCVDKLDCDGYEFLMYGAWYDQTDSIRRFFKDFPAPIPVFHVDKRIGDMISRNEGEDSENALKLFALNCALANDIGAEKLVVHLWGGLDSDKDTAHTYEYYKYLRQISDAHGLLLTIENIVCNNLDPMRHMLNLAERYPDIQFTFDTKMAAFHSQLDLLYMEENAKLLPHIQHMHMNDYNGGYKDWKNLRTLHIGEGIIDFDRLFAFVRKLAYCGDFTVEATSFDRLNRCFRKIRESIR